MSFSGTITGADIPDGAERTAMDGTAGQSSRLRGHRRSREKNIVSPQAMVDEPNVGFRTRVGENSIIKCIIHALRKIKYNRGVS